MKGISLVELFEREEKSVIFVWRKMDSKGLTDVFCGCEEVGKTFWPHSGLAINYSYFKYWLLSWTFQSENKSAKLPLVELTNISVPYMDVSPPLLPPTRNKRSYLLFIKILKGRKFTRCRGNSYKKNGTLWGIKCRLWSLSNRKRNCRTWCRNHGWPNLKHW